MTDAGFRIAELLLSGLRCSHVLVRLALEAQGRDDPDLVRAMSGLANGMGQGFNCGALSGGCCVLGLVAGRAGESEADDPRFAAALDAFTGWFHAAAHERWGGIDCADIMKFDPVLKAERCPALILEVWEQLCDTLADHGFDVAEPPDAEGRR
ncbi:DVU_1555 family C-GCAxxG-C-C protein [Siculibacillus lacustris]|nr:DV_1555 family C-GCAxxG-C-C protein [Siculibacillus lacustris]